MKKVYLITLVLLLSLANSGLAVEHRWTGDYSSDYSYSLNWDPAGPPADGNSALIEEWDGVSAYATPTYWPQISASTACGSLQIGYECPIDETNNYGYLTITSGTVDIDSDLRVGYGSEVGSEDYGELTISGGTLNIGDDMRIGSYGNGTLNMSGGLFMSLDRDEALDLANESGSVATVDISGGIVDVHGITVGDGTADVEVSSTGTIKVEYDQEILVSLLVLDGIIHGTGYGPGDPGGVSVEYDSQQDKTIIEPGVFVPPDFNDPFQLCGKMDLVNVMDGEYRISNNAWGSCAREQCIELYLNSTYFDVVHSTHVGGCLAAYPFVLKGCHWGNCTEDSGMPIQISNVVSAPFTWSFDTSGVDGTWNAAYESFFSSTGGTSPDKAELMIWLDYKTLGPGGSYQDTESIGGYTWDIYHASPWGSWDHYICYKITDPVDSVSLDFRDFIDDSLARGWLDSSWYLDNMEAGFELAVDGEGLRTNSFSASINPPPPPPDLVGHWELDDGSGTTAEDSSSENNDGTLGGDPQWGSGKYGDALTFDGTGDCVDLGNPSVLDFGTGDFTLCAWVKNPAGNNVVAKGGDQSGGIRYALQVGSTVQLLVDDNDDKESVSGGSGLQDGYWHHVAGTRNGQTLRVFVDSNQVASQALPHSPYDLSGTSQHNAYIGALWQHQDNQLGDFYTGSVDDVRIYSGALTSEQLEVVMGPPDTTPPAAPTGLGATAVSGSQINLDWNDNTEPDLAGYNVYSSETTGTPYDLVESGVTESSYSDTGLEAETTYYYVVTAVDTSNNESSDSAEANATTEAAEEDSVGWWKLDETSGTTAVDSSAEENDGTLNGDPAWEVNGQVDGALDFDGTGDYVNIGNQSVLDFGTGDWTICAWIKTTAGGDVFSKGWDGSGGIRYEFNIGTTIKLEVDDNSNKVRAYGTTTVNDGYWHHVAVMRDGTTLRTYTDGDPEGTNTVSSGYDLSGTSQGSAYIGVIYDDGDSEFNTFFDGLIDDVHIYDYALTEQEIAAVMGS